MSAVSMASSEPPPVATPKSAAFSDGASLTPSPVIPMTLSRTWNYLTIRSFWSGVILLQ